MSAISVFRRGSSEKDVAGVYDINACIRSWGRRGIVWGGLSGFVLGAIFVANPVAADALTFGTIGTLIVCVIECAVAGGGFGALLAALNGQGVLRSDTTGLAQRRATGRRPSNPFMLPAVDDHGDSMDSLRHDTQRSSTIRRSEDEDGAFAQETVTASAMNPFVVFVTNSAAEVRTINRPR
jgi:hypothetical protein